MNHGMMLVLVLLAWARLVRMLRVHVVRLLLMMM